jgi:hypothetical protein
MKKALMYRISYLVEIEDSEDGSRELRRKLNNAMWERLPEEGIALDDSHVAEWQSTTELLLNPLTMNCGQCARCHGWTTDREKQDPVTGLCNGATVNGELLCDECLPKGHRWAF